jgi:dihydropteroate synthase
MIRRKLFRLRLPTQTVELGRRTLIMGVLNVTPDSFSDGGKFLDPRRAIEQGLALQRTGADILDIGAESTRPGSLGTPAVEELRRLLPVLQALRGKLKIPISVDTRKSAVAEAAIAAGAQILNDVSGLGHDARLAEVAARRRVPLILMHMRGEPRTMQQGPFARDVLKDVTQGLRRSIQLAQKAGVHKSQIILDPGIGFGKSFRQNYELLANLPELAKLEYPLLVGTSRKGFLGATLARRGTLTKLQIGSRAMRTSRGGRTSHHDKPAQHGSFAMGRSQSAPVGERLWATAATVAASILGGAHIVRVHDVVEMVQVARTTDLVLDAYGRL